MTNHTARTTQCALTKLSYLLSKPELSVAQVRSLIGTPLRGELTLPESKVPAALGSQAPGASAAPSLDHLQGLLSQVVRLSAPASATPHAPRILVDGAAAPDADADADENSVDVTCEPDADADPDADAAEV